mmetsp:Transcript_20686/g.45392  ORF Transcript_20686/g.45392 Transcript_20686/m.45392 type:complete len:207 (-) Transcript_20686:1232-1852(-)
MPSEARNSGFVGSISKSALEKIFSIRGSSTSTWKPLSSSCALAWPPGPRFLDLRLKFLSSTATSSTKSSRSPFSCSASLPGASSGLRAALDFLASRAFFEASRLSLRFAFRLSRYCCHTVFSSASSATTRLPPPCFCTFSVRSLLSCSVFRLKVASISPMTCFGALSLSSSSSLLSPERSSSAPRTRLRSASTRSGSLSSSSLEAR